MAKRLALITFLTVMMLVVVAPAALAAPSQRSDERHNELALAKAGEAATNAKAIEVSNAGGKGKSHAAQNAGRGMNRIGVPGVWKDNGHVPSLSSTPQGHSPSDPDAGGNGGMDKPGGTGGFDDDRDGNNGCGNDTDREDDNNGWCGTKPDEQVTNPPTGGTGGGGSKPPTTVLPRRTTPPAPLPTTGSDLGDLLWGGWGLVLAGTSLRRTAHHRRRR